MRVDCNDGFISKLIEITNEAMKVIYENDIVHTHFSISLDNFSTNETTDPVVILKKEKSTNEYDYYVTLDINRKEIDDLRKSYKNDNEFIKFFVSTFIKEQINTFIREDINKLMMKQKELEEKIIKSNIMVDEMMENLNLPVD